MKNNSKNKNIEQLSDKLIDVIYYFTSKSYQTFQHTRLTSLKLNQLVYFAQAIHLVFNNKPLFKDEIIGCVRGPLIPYLSKNFDSLMQGFTSEHVYALSKKEKKTLDLAWDNIAKCEVEYIEMIYKSQDPWIESREGIPEYRAGTIPVKLETMKEYYTELIKTN